MYVGVFLLNRKNKGTEKVRARARNKLPKNKNILKGESGVFKVSILTHQIQESIVKAIIVYKNLGIR